MVYKITLAFLALLIFGIYSAPPDEPSNKSEIVKLLEAEVKNRGYPGYWNSFQGGFINPLESPSSFQEKINKKQVHFEVGKKLPKKSYPTTVTTTTTTSNQEQREVHFIELCPSKKPNRYWIPQSPNNEKMEDALKSTARRSEERNRFNTNDYILGTHQHVLNSISIQLHTMYYITFNSIQAGLD